jgi:hypothetical protein
MSRFEPVLRRAEAALDVPRPARATIVTELAADLESLYETYRARGLQDDDAAARATYALGLDCAAAEELTRLHAPRFRRWTAALSARGRATLERTLVTVLFLALALGGVAGVARADLLHDSSPVVWPLLGLAGAMLALASGLWFRLVIAGRDVDGSAAVRAIGAIALATPLMGLIATVLELNGLAHDLVALGGFSLDTAAPALRRAAQATSLALTIGLLSFLAWFHLRLGIDRHARAAAELARASHEGGV